MRIAVHLSNRLIAEALYELLITNGYDDVVVSGKSPATGSAPDVLVVDSTTLTRETLAQYPEAKVLLMDTGMETEKLYAMLLSYRIHGILSPHTELHVLKKALKAITQGQLWIDDQSVKTLLQDTGAMSRPGKVNGITEREKEIIACVCEGLSNKEIAQRLGLSEYTVKSHLNNIFRKLNVTSRSHLMALALDGPLARSATCG